MRTVILILFVLISAIGCAELQSHPYRTINYKATPLHIAAANGDVDLVKKLLSDGMDVNIRAKVTNETPLHAAAWAGQPDTAKLLIEHGADVNAQTDWGATPLFYAAGLDHKECRLLTLDQVIRYGSVTPGLSKGYFKVAKLLIEHGADVNQRSRSNQTALMSAAVCNASDIVLLLINHGANLDVREHQYTALEMAVIRAPDAAAILIKHGAKVNTADPYTKNTVLHNAVIAKRHALVELLLQYGANPDAINNAGYTPRDVSAESSIDEIFKRYARDKNSK